MNLLPVETDFPYAMRLVSDILDPTLFFDGHRLRRLSRHDGRGRSAQVRVRGLAWASLSAMAKIFHPTTCGAEDHYGDMDFKLPLTFRRHRVQMDIKVTGISIPMMREALAQAKKARLEILDIMDRHASASRAPQFLPTHRASSAQHSTDKIATSSVRAARK